MFYSPHYHHFAEKSFFSFASLFCVFHNLQTFFFTCDTVSMDRHEKGQRTGGSVSCFSTEPTRVACLPNNKKENEQKRLKAKRKNKTMWFTKGDYKYILVAGLSPIFSMSPFSEENGRIERLVESKFLFLCFPTPANKENNKNARETRYSLLVAEKAENEIYQKAFLSFDSETFPCIAGWFRAYHRTRHFVCLPKTKSDVCEVLKKENNKTYILELFY